MIPNDAPFGRSRRSIRARLVAAVAAAAIVVAGLGLTPGDAAAQTDEATPTEAAGSWLADQLVEGERFESEFDGTVYPDYGLTADTVVALAAAGVADDFAAAATAWLGASAQTVGYAGDGTTSDSSGGLAKLAIVAQARGLDARNWGEDGVDLIQRLLDLEVAGRFVDVPDFGDGFKTFGHAFAIVALAREAGVDPSDASLDLLLGSQCADGGFSGDLNPSPCESGIDSTATALMALLAADRADDDTEIADAVAYLIGLQQPGGGFATDGGGDPNANSSGLATYVLGLAGETDATQSGQTFLLSLQQGCDAAEADRGGIAFDATGFDAATAPRATAQAILGLSGAGYLEASAAGATTAQPRFSCPDPVDPTDPTTTTTTTEPGAVNSAGTGATPAATPVRATPTFTG